MEYIKFEVYFTLGVVVIIGVGFIVMQVLESKLRNKYKGK